MNVEKPVHAGILLFPPQGKIVLKKAWQSKFCALFAASRFGMERLEVYDTSTNDISIIGTGTSKILTLDGCVKIAQKDTTTFEIVTKTWNNTFGATDGKELQEWIVNLQNVAFKDDSSRAQSIVEDNELYCSSGEGVFTVHLSSSDASERCGLQPVTYTLVLTNTEMQLRFPSNDNLLYTWPYKYIRRYGYSNGKFTFEAGRKCQSGEGKFHLEHSNREEIFRCLSTKMKSMMKTKPEDSTPNSVSQLNTIEGQFQAAVSMEARSRSPISLTTPSSPTYPSSFSSSSFQQPFSYNQPSLLSQTGITGMTGLPITSKFLSTTAKTVGSKISTLESNAGGSCQNKKNVPVMFPDSQKPMKKIIPNKPPRKNVPTKTEIPETPDYELIEDNPKNLNYDIVEVRNDAWRTLGVDDVNHTENYSTVLENNLLEETQWPKQQPKEPNRKGPSFQEASKIITQVQCQEDDENYDKLQFFSAPSKLTKVRPGYTTVMHGQIGKDKGEKGEKMMVVKPQASFGDFDINDYEEVHVEPTLEDVCKKPSASTSSYKQVTVTSDRCIKCEDNEPPAWYAYDVINVDTKMEAVRSADDSHLGYGMIRRSSKNDGLADGKNSIKQALANNVVLQCEGIPHNIINETAYAVISKPKRV